MTTIALKDLVDPDPDDKITFPVVIDQFTLQEPPTPKAVENLKKLHKLGLLTAEGIFALIAQAPIDPINLAYSLMRMFPDNWTFSASDFTMFRVLAKDSKRGITAALRVDLIDGESIMALARNKANQLTEFRTLKVEPGKNNEEAVRMLVADTIAAAAREGGN